MFKRCLSVADLGGSLLETNDDCWTHYVEMVPFLQLGFFLISFLDLLSSTGWQFFLETISQLQKKTKKKKTQTCCRNSVFLTSTIWFPDPKQIYTPNVSNSVYIIYIYVYIYVIF